MAIAGQIHEAVQEKRRAALLSILSAMVLVCLKAFLVLRTGSLGVLSEALHSGLDLVAAVITFLSVRVADRPADDRHPYGHGKFENFSAFIETGLLALTALYIIYEAFSRLFFHSVHIEPSLAAILILFVALLIDVTRARALNRVARRAALFDRCVEHGRGDRRHCAGVGRKYMECSVARVCGCTGEFGGGRGHPVGWLAARPPDDRCAARCSSRGPAPRDYGRDRAHGGRAGRRTLTDAIEKRVGEIIPSDVLVHTEPRAPRNENLFEAIRAQAQRMDLAIHDIAAFQQDGDLFVELHLEVDENLSLRDAHRRATELEEAIRALGNGGPKVDVNIHIEPLGRHIATPDIRVGEMRQLELAVDSFLNRMPKNYDELINCHDVRVRQVEHHILVSCHCVMKSDLPITRIHDVTAALEDHVKERFPQIFRVTIHPEPPEET